MFRTSDTTIARESLTGIGKRVFPPRNVATECLVRNVLYPPAQRWPNCMGRLGQTCARRATRSFTKTLFIHSFIQCLSARGGQVSCDGVYLGEGAVNRALC